MGVGNILGQPFYKYVNKQIETRQKVYGSGFTGRDTTSNRRNASYNQYLNSRSAWLKMASSVVVIDKREITEENAEGVKTTRTDEGGIRFLDKLSLDRSYKGINLAREAVLFSGLQGTGNLIPSSDEDPLDRRDSFEGNTTFKQRSGIAKGQGAWTLNSAYGLGGREYGQQPMPGITDFSIKSLNRGSLKRAEVTIKANNKYQFELIETLYLRLGYSMMIEWGYSHYLPNLGGVKIQDDPNTPLNEAANIPLVDTVKNTYIEEKWFQQEGETQTNILGQIEDYRRKYSGNYDGFFGKVVNFSWKFNSDGTYDINISLISLGDVVESLKFNSLYNPSDGVPVDVGQDVNDITNKLNQIKLESDNFNNGSKTHFFTGATNKLYQEYLSLNTSDLYGAKKSQFDLDGDGEVDEEFADLKAINAQQQKYGYYWRFGKMLQWIQEYIIPNYSSGNKVFKQILIDVNEAVNIMAVYPNQFSIDPRVCIVKTEYGDKLNFQEGEKPSFYKYMADWVDTETVPESPHGKIMNIYVNFDQITSIISANRNKKGDIDFYSFFSKLLDNINRALGGINNLELVVEEDSNTIKIIDQNPIPGSATEKKSKENFFNKFIKKPDVGETSTMLEIYGYNSNGSGYQSNFVKDFNFETKIDKNYANTLAIAASAGGVSVGEDATAFSKWGYGLVDKYKEQITPPSKDTNATGSGESPLLIVNEYETYTYTYEGKTTGGSSMAGGGSSYKGGSTKYKSQEFNEKGEIIENKNFNPGTTKTTTEKEYFITPEGEKLIENITDRIYNSDLSFYITECFGTPATGEQVPVIVTKTPQDKAKVLENAQAGNSQNTSSEYIKKHGYYTEFNNDRILRGQASMKNYLYNMAKQHYKETNSPTGTGGFMPLDLGLTVDGISGIKIFNSINVDTRFLPSAYGEDLDFIVKGVDHKVSNGEWSTQLSALSIPRPTLSIFEVIENEITLTSSIEPANPEDAYNEPVLTPIDSADDNYIIRMDGGGSGLFGASRGDRSHSGLDFLSIEGQETFAPITGLIRKSNPSTKTPKLTGIAIKGTGEYEGVEVKCFYTTTEFRSDLEWSYQDNITVKRAERIGLAQNVLGEGKYNPRTNSGMQNHIHFEIKVNGEVLALQSSATNFGNLTNWQSKPNVPASFTIQNPQGIRTEGINELVVARVVKAQIKEFTQIYRDILITETRGNSNTAESEAAVATIIRIIEYIGQDSWDNPELTLQQLIDRDLVLPSGTVDPDVKYINNKSDLLSLPLRAFVNGFIKMYIYFNNIDPNSNQGKFNTKGVDPIGITYPVINPKHPDKGNSRKLVFEYNFQLMFSKLYDSPNITDGSLEDALEEYWMYRGSDEKFDVADIRNNKFDL